MIVGIEKNICIFNKKKDKEKLRTIKRSNADQT
jgi:hypothetical protein